MLKFVEIFFTNYHQAIKININNIMKILIIVVITVMEMIYIYT